MDLYAQSDLLSLVRSTIEDNGSEQRYTDEKVYRSLSLSMSRWAGVRPPHIYDVGTVSSSRSVALPAYMDQRIEVQLRTTAISQETPDPYVTIHGWEIVPDGEGGMNLEFRVYPVSGDLRILWFAPPPRIPIVSTLPVLDADISDSATELTATGIGSIAPSRCGYIRIGSEWMWYTGTTLGADQATLTVALRGVEGTVAAAHAAGDSVEWGVAVVQPEQLLYLLALTMESLHTLFITGGNPNERDNHSVSIRYWQEQAKQYRMALPQRSPQFSLSPQAFGDTW